MVNKRFATLVGTLATITLLTALAVRPARADFKVPNGNYFQSDPWGSAFDTSGWQTVWQDQSGFGATWDWHYGTAGYDSIKAYPSWIVGWVFGGSFPGTDRHGFPVAVSNNPPIPTKWAYSLWGNNIYDASFDVWVIASPGATYPSGEIMVWLNENGLNPIKNWGSSAPGQRITDAAGRAAPGTYTVYWGNTNDGQGHTWPVWSFVLDAPYRTTSWNSNLAPFVANVAASNSWVRSQYIGGVQGGIEIADSNPGNPSGSATGGFHTNWGDFWSSAY